MSDLACRSCGSEGLEIVLSLGDQPPANALRTEPEAAIAEARYPLDVAVCPGCGLVQLTVSLPPSDLFDEYQYFTSYSPILVANAEAVVERLVVDRGLGSGSLAMEIASNDGYLLQHYVGRGVPSLGIDPARNVIPAAEARGVETICTHFGTECADELRAAGRLADVIHANNVMAHVPDPNGVVSGMARVLKSDGRVVIETPYVRDLIEKLEFDTIYHEHLFYYSLTALGRLLERNGLSLTDVEHIPIHGGSLRVYAAHSATASASPAVETMLEDEHQLGMDRPDYYRGFAAQVDQLRDLLRALLDDLHRQGRRVAGYGAAAKATVMLNALGRGADSVEFVVDQSPHKQGRYVPGVGIPVVPVEQLLAEQPDDVVLFAWNFADEIVQQQDEYRSRGGRFIIPLPEPTVIA